MPPFQLSQSQVDQLVAARDGQNPEQYYLVLRVVEPYADLALGVVQDNTFPGVLGNNFAENKLREVNGVSFATSVQQQINVSLMENDYDLRLGLPQNGGIPPSANTIWGPVSGNQISDYHDEAFASLQFTPRAWTPYAIVRVIDYEIWRDTSFFNYLSIYSQMFVNYVLGNELARANSGG